MKVLVLAGTAEASSLVRLLAAEAEVDVVASFAGHTSVASDWPCPVRIGGFGGAAGLAAIVRRDGFDAVVNATHPFSATMTANAAAAAALAGVSHLRLVRPPWSPFAGGRWEIVDDIGAAAIRVQALGGACAFLTVGRLEIEPFRAIEGVRLVVRSIEAPDPAMLPDGAVVVTGRGPFAVEDELDLMRRYGVDVLVTKNSGGDDAKLRAARQVGATTVMVQRPVTDVPAGAVTPEQARRWIMERACDGS